MKIAFISSEVLPFVKTGGLADVSGALPKALSSLGVKVKVFMPLYSQIDRQKFSIEKINSVHEFTLLYGGEVYRLNLYSAQIPGSNVETIFIDCPELFDRKTLYTIKPDEGKRFGLFNIAVIEAITRLNYAPDIIHCNDWQTGLIPLLLKENYSSHPLLKSTSSLFTIHNIAYQGMFSQELIKSLNLNQCYSYPTGPLEYYGNLNFLKAGLVFADIINTVSEKYSEEILTKEFGAGMEGILAERKEKLYGILNGVDCTEWDPSHDKLIPFNYNLDDISPKQKNKTELLKKAGFDNAADLPLIGIVSRMVEQKGTELIVDIIDELLKLDVRFAVLGSGMEEYELLFKEIALRYPEKFYLVIGYDNELAHLIEAGSDIFLMPSRYEPCGLNQIYSLKYGTVPIVRYTGGLADTVHDAAMPGETKNSWTGFVFNEFNGKALLKTIMRALNTFKDKPLWLQIMTNGMNKNYSWNIAAQKYMELYKKVRKN